MSENPGLIPANVDVADAQRDMVQFDALRPHIARLTKLLDKCSGLNALRSDMAVRFTRRSRADKSPAPTG